jgi:hypothetical protein
MNTSAIIMLVVVGIIVWGGFILTMIIALKREKSKK